MRIQIPTDVDDEYIIFTLIFMLSNRLQTIGDSFFKEVSTKQWFVLLVLGIMNDHSPTLNELSDAVGSSHQNVKQLVLKLQQKGYVNLTKDEKDARRLRIRLTSKSWDFNEVYHDKSELFFKKLFVNLSESDLSATKNVMLTLRDTLERMGKEYVTE